MLKIATQENLSEILEFCGADLLGARIGCYCLAYGFDRDFLNVWIEETDNGINTVIAKFYDSMTVVSDSDSFCEINDFISMIGYRNLETYYYTCENLKLKAVTFKKAYIFSGKAEDFEAEDLSEEYYKSLYDLVSENISGSFLNTKEAYLSFLSDFTFRKKRNLARCKGFINDTKLISSVITAAETPKAALISAVASDRCVRGGGYGKKTVLSLVNELQNEDKRVFVIALNESAESFYEHIGFEYYNKIAVIN